MTNAFLRYKERLRFEQTRTHTWDEKAKQEILNTIIKRNVNDMDTVMNILFDYAFKCGIQKSLDLIEGTNNEN
jgi:hypothetical protein